MKPKRRTPKGNVAHHGKTAAIVRATRTASPNAPGKASWPKAFAPKPTLEEQNRRAAEFRQQKRQAAEDAEKRALAKYLESKAERKRGQRREIKVCLMCNTPALDGEDFCEVHATK